MGTIDFSIGGIWADLTHNWKGKVRRFRIHLFAFALFMGGLLEAIDPYAIQALLPGRWGAALPVGLAVLMWLNRKITDHPVLVSTTTYEGEHDVTTEPTQAAEHPDPTEGPANPTDAHAAARLADDGGPQHHE